MPTAVRRAAWAEWAGWTCKEPEGSLRSDVHRRLVDRETPVGKPAGVFSFWRDMGVESSSLYWPWWRSALSFLERVNSGQ